MVEKIVMFEALVEQKEVWHRMVSSVQRNRVASAYLFYGSSGIGKEGYALKFAALLNCHQDNSEPCSACPSCTKFLSLQHPNLTLIVPLPRDRDITKDDTALKALSKQNMNLLTEFIANKVKNPYTKIALPRANRILLNSIRELRRTIYLKISEPGRKVITIFDAHKLASQQGEAGNALLKILEEPPDETTFILTTDYPDQLQDTIRSRCQRVYFPVLPDEVLIDFFVHRYHKTQEEAILISHLCQGNVRIGQSLVKRDLSEVDSLLDSLILWISEESESNWRRFVHNGAYLYRSNPQEFSFQLQLLSYWFRDALHLRQVKGDSDLILSEQKEKLENYIQRYPDGDFNEIIDRLETCVDSLSRNYNINLILMNLLFDVRDSLQGRVNQYA